MTPTLPSTSTLPSLGLGTFPFSGVFTPLDQQAASDVLRAFVEAGGWYIETAPVYAPNGINFEQLIKSVGRERLFLATKCVTGRDATGATVRSGKSHHLREQCHSELKRLGVNHLDLLQLHTVPEDASAEESFGTLQELKAEGLVRNVGASNVSLAQLKAFQAVGPVDFVQNRFSFIYQAQHREIEGFCLENGTLLNPYQVIERGLLTDNPRQAFRDGDLRNNKYEYSGDVYAYIRSWVLSDLKPIADTHGVSVTRLALGWAVHQPAVGVIPVGATSTQQVRVNMAASTVPLPSDVIAEMESAFERLEGAVRDRVGLSVDEYRGL
ncbi:aldo/keto reductase [Streptomyces sp. NPDC056462]|uniref:aldo/keto reductase n=1 Tax=Streptomyces sp. NPDC056462 TaxID=3345826 RepID=UPI00367A7EA2